MKRCYCEFIDDGSSWMTVVVVLTTSSRHHGGVPAIRYRSSRHIFRIFAAAKFPPNSLRPTARTRYDTCLDTVGPLLYNFMDWQSWVKHQSTIKKRLRHDNGLQQFRCINSWRFRYDVYTTTTTLGCWTLTFATLHLHIQEEELWRLLSPSLALF
jgi:hypothetical protein